MTQDDTLALKRALELYLNGDRIEATADSLAGDLGRDPARLAELLSDLRLARMLAQGHPGDAAPVPPATLALARQLESRVNARVVRGWWFRGASAAALVLAGWLGHAAVERVGGPGLPPLVDAALDVQTAMDVRLLMVSQPESPAIDRRELAARLGLHLPALPETWRLLDAQVVPTDDAPGLAMVLDTPSMGRIVVMTVTRPADDRLDPPRGFDVAGTAVAVFEDARSAYVFLDQGGTPEELSREARALLPATF